MSKTNNTPDHIRRETWQEAIDWIRDQWLAAYPTSVFPEPLPPPAEASRDLISAAMGRHMAKRLIVEFENKRDTPIESEEAA